MAMEPNQVGKLEIPVEFKVDKAKLNGAFKRDVEEQAKQVGRRQAEVQADAFIKGLEVQYQRRLGEAREELLRGLINPKEFERRGREAAQAMNKAILSEIERRGKAGTIGAAYNQDFNTLAGAFKNVGTEAKQGVRGIGEMRESFASLLAQAAGVHPVLGRIVNVMGGLAMGSVLMGGVLAGLSALAWWWNKVREDARDAKEEQERGLELLLRIKREKDLGPRGETGAAIEGQRTRQAEIVRQQEELRKAWKEGTSLSDPTARIAQLQADYDKIEAAILDGEEQLLKAARDAAPDAPGPQLEDPKKRQQEATRAREKAEQEAQQAAARLAALEADVQKQLMSLTATATDDLLLALDRLEAEGREAAAKAGTEVSQAFLDGIASLREAAAATGRLEGLQGALGDVLRLDDLGDQQTALAALIARIREETAALKEGSRARKEYVELLHRAEDAHKKNAETTKKDAEAQTKRDDAETQRLAAEDLRNLRERARLIEENARAAIQLANAFGIVSDETANILGNLAQLGSAVARIAGGDMLAIPSAIGAAAQILKGFGGGSDREFEQRERTIGQMIALERALRALTDQVASTLTESEREDLLAGGGIMVTTARHDKNYRVTEGTYQYERLVRIAELLGISLDTLIGPNGAINPDALEKALDAIRNLSIGMFGEDLEGRLDAFAFLTSQLGDAAGTATDQLKRFLDVIAGAEGGKASKFADEFRRIFDEQGATAAEAFLQMLLGQFASNDQSLFGAGGMFEGLTAEEVKRLLEESNGLLERLTSGAAGTTQDFVQARSITEITATRIEGALYTENMLSAERNALLRQLVGAQLSPSMMSSLGSGRSLDPDLFNTAPAMGGGGVTLNLNGPVIGEASFTAMDGGIISEAQQQAQVAAVGKAVTREILEQVDQHLGSRLRDRRRTLGRN